MLATLPNIGVIDIWNRQSRVHSLIMPPLFGVNAFSDGGQGPEKPPIVEETDSEEEIFTFDYPKKGGEISDLLHPPVEGIAAKAYSVPIKKIQTSGRDAISYIFINPQKTPATGMYRDEFVSLTNQTEIARSYTGSLIYAGYSSSGSFSYLSTDPYETTSNPLQTNIYEKNRFDYEIKMPMPSFSQRAYHEAEDAAYKKDLTQPQLESYQKFVETSSFEPVKSYELPHGLEAPKLELPAIIDEVELPHDSDVTLDYAQLELPAKIDELPSNKLEPIEQPKADPHLTSNYKNTDRLLELPVNLGFDDINLRDSFFADLDNAMKYTTTRDVAPNIPDAAARNDVAQIYESKEAHVYQHDVRLDDNSVKMPVIPNRALTPVNDKVEQEYKHAKENKKRTIEIKVDPSDFKVIGFDDPSLAQKAMSEQKLRVQDQYGEQRGEEPRTFPYKVEAVDNTVLEQSPINYTINRVSSDPFSLFTAQSPQQIYQNNAQVRNVVLPETRHNSDTRVDLADRVRTQYDTTTASFPRARSLANDYALSNSELQPDIEIAVSGDVENIEQDLEDSLETDKQEEMPKEKTEENIESKTYDNSKSDVYEKNQAEEEKEAEAKSNGYSQAVGLAATAVGAVGVGVLAGAAEIVGAFFNKDKEEENPNEQDKALYESEEKTSSNDCGDTSQCFAETIDWLEGKLEDPTLSNEEYESMSQCYAEDIKNIQKAREFIKKREDGYSCNGGLYNLFHHVGFSDEQEKNFTLKDYIRDDEVQNGFKLATTMLVEDDITGEYDVEAIWVDDEKNGQSENVTLKKSSAYSQLDIGLREQGYTPVWKIMSYIDTDTGEKRSGLYLETIAELHLEAKEQLGGKDKYGMNLMGLILLVNGTEPGQGTISMHDYNVMPGDKIEAVFKNDSSKYEDPLVEEEPIEKDLEPLLI